MEYIYPTFERGRIMKKESLWALRDYSYTALELQYQEYADGIINGCKIGVEGNDLCVGAGLIKCQGFIYLISVQRIPYCATNEVQYLKFAVLERQELPDYIKYVAQIGLDEKPPRGSREIELCRFKLREGSVLRTEYKDFYDIQTEFDTVNLADAGWGSRGGTTLSMEITDAYARKILECDGADPIDIQFAYLALQGREAVNRDMLVDYLVRRGGKDTASDKWTHNDMFAELESILQAVRSGKDIRSRQKTGRADRMIILD